jgi:hypothetical protein
VERVPRFESSAQIGDVAHFISYRDFTIVSF